MTSDSTQSPPRTEPTPAKNRLGIITLVLGLVSGLIGIAPALYWGFGGARWVWDAIPVPLLQLIAAVVPLAAAIVGGVLVARARPRALAVLGLVLAGCAFILALLLAALLWVLWSLSTPTERPLPPAPERDSVVLYEVEGSGSATIDYTTNAGDLEDEQTVELPFTEQVVVTTGGDSERGGRSAMYTLRVELPGTADDEIATCRITVDGEVLDETSSEPGDPFLHCQGTIELLD